MKLLLIGCITSILGFAILFLASYSARLYGWDSAPEVIGIILGAALGLAVIIRGFKVIVAFVLKLNHF